ncbi:MAG: helix-turn-helix transcriptional regulator [Clostridia bacterium]|nr:helix-turn-helix transcriptional regulator [Clostridia bacterium]
MKLNLNENIRMHRRKFSWTQEMLAERLGVSFQSVSRWENGTSMPDIELIVTMAGIFGCTVDELLGSGKHAEKPSCAEIAKQLEDAYTAGDGEEIVRLLRLIRWEYCEEFDRYDDWTAFVRAAFSGAYRIPGVLEEFRLLADDFLSRSRNPNIRGALLRTMAMIEDDTRAEEFIRENAGGCFDLRADALLLERYGFRGDWENYRKNERIRRYRMLLDVLMPEESDPADPDLRCAVSESRLAVLRALSPDAPENAPDIWAGVRLADTLDCAKNYSRCGRTDEALAMLETAADLADALADLPNRAVLPCYTPEFSPLPLMKRDLKEEDGRIIMTEIATVPEDESRPYDYTGCGMFQLWTCGGEMNDDAFEAIREDPRFLTAAERMKKHNPYGK